MKLFNNNIFLKDVLFKRSRIFHLTVSYVFSMSYAIPEE
jgi:hypothetical protein